MIYASRVIQRATRRRLSVEGWSYCRSGKSLIWVRNSDGYVARKRPKPIPPRKPKSAKLLWEIFRQSVRFCVSLHPTFVLELRTTTTTQVRKLFDLARIVSNSNMDMFRQVFQVKYKIYELEAERNRYEKCTTKDSKVYWYVKYMLEVYHYLTLTSYLQTGMIRYVENRCGSSQVSCRISSTCMMFGWI